MIFGIQISNKIQINFWTYFLWLRIPWAKKGKWIFKFICICFHFLPFINLNRNKRIQTRIWVKMIIYNIRWVAGNLWNSNKIQIWFLGFKYQIKFKYVFWDFSNIKSNSNMILWKISNSGWGSCSRKSKSKKI